MVMPGTPCHVGASWNLLDDMILNISRVPGLSVVAAILVQTAMFILFSIICFQDTL